MPEVRTDHAFCDVCNRKIYRGNIQRHYRSYHHRWHVERNKAECQGLIRFAEKTKQLDILKALGGRIFYLRTKVRRTRYGQIFKLMPEAWVDRFMGVLTSELWLRLPWRKAVRVAEALGRDRTRLVLLRLGGSVIEHVNEVCDELGIDQPWPEFGHEPDLILPPMDDLGCRR